MTTVEVVVGAQYGSEAKGHVTQRLTERAQASSRDTPHVVRVAGPNAGHTGYDAGGHAWALRQVPVAAVTRGSVVLGVAAGSEIDPPVLLDEYDRLLNAGLLRNKALWVHGEATIIEDAHKDIESAGADLVHKIGSTGKGIGAARADRIMRKAKRVIDDEGFMAELTKRGIPVTGPAHMPIGEHIIVEGTQGYGLGLRAGHYPQCTSSDCRAIDFLAMAGVNPWKADVLNIWAVARMFPIRVAGNSGPLKDETTWEALGLPEERTTVTKKVRRVGMPDWDLVARAVLANGGAPTVRLALTMVDQMFPSTRDKGIAAILNDDKMTKNVLGYIRDVERMTEAKVGMFTTGPDTASFMPTMEAIQ